MSRATDAQIHRLIVAMLLKFGPVELPLDFVNTFDLQKHGFEAVVKNDKVLIRAVSSEVLQ